MNAFLPATIGTQTPAANRLPGAALIVRCPALDPGNPASLRTQDTGETP